MQVTQIKLEEAGIFSEQHVRMVCRPAEIEPYVQRLFTKEMFKHQLEAKAFAFADQSRKILVSALNRQYAQSGIEVNHLDRLLSPHAFTVTTGHQLTLLAGPLYFVVKILEVIKLAEELNALYPASEVIPVFWMASEDHDFEEIQSANVFNRNLRVDYEQRGPVGRFSVEKLDEFKAEILSLFGEDKREEIGKILEEYSGENLSIATRKLVHHLFGERGLIIVDGDDLELKQLFAPIMLEELKQGASETAVLKTNAALEVDGFKIQVHPRPINLFYIENGLRERIERTATGFSAGDKQCSEHELYSLLEADPTHFSPNVILRPVYQETVLPNLAYVGGAGEISYWLQLKGVFDLYNIVYPIIQVRNSVLWMDKTTLKRMEKIGMDWKNAFKPADTLKKEYVQEHSSDELDFSELDALTSKLIGEITERTTAVDPNMKQFAESESKRLENQLENIKAKLVKASKGKHEQAMASIEVIKERLFPNGGLQERSTHFFSFCADGVIKSRLDELYEAIDPFSEQLIVLMETDSVK